MNKYIDEFFLFGNRKSEKKKDKAYIPPNCNKPFPGTKAKYESSYEDFINSKRGKKFTPVEYLYELHYFGYDERLCTKIALANMVEMSEVFYGDEAPTVKASKFFKENGLGVLCDTDGFGYMYSPKTKKWYYYDHERTPQINPNKPLGFSAVMSSARREYDEFMKDYEVPDKHANESYGFITKPSHEEMTMMMEVKYNDKDKYHLNQYVSEHGCYPEFMMDIAMEACTPPEIHTDKLDLRGMTFIHAAHEPGAKPTENSCLMVNGKKYRVRVETLIYNDKGEIYAAKRDKPTNFNAFYKIPGGSAEPGKTLEQQAIAESQEEVRANVKNIKFTGIWYINEFDDSDDKRLGTDTVSWLEKVGLKYDGFITVVFVGKYAGKFNGRIKKEDQVDWIKDVKFHDPKDLNLIEPHKMALQKIWFNTNSLSK